MWQGGARVPEGGFKALEGPSNLLQKLDYVARTDGQPVYMGFAEKGTQDTDLTWLIQKFTYTTIGGADYMSIRQSAVGDWTSRASLSYS